MTDKILTITVPAYNAEKYLDYNLQSFNIKEIRDRIEVLIIDDGSTDRTGMIARKYADEYPDTFRLISKENGGHGSGINVGIANASGKYFKVVDADDWVTAEGLKTLVRTLEKAEADIVAANFLWAYDDGTSDPTQFKTRMEIKEPFCKVTYGKQYVFDEVAEKLYLKMHSLTIRTAVLKENRIQLDEHCYYVDTEYDLYPVPFIHSVVFLKEIVYMYRYGTGTQSMSIESMRRNEQNYDKVLHSLCGFYEKLEELGCSQPKRTYAANMIARVVAGKIKVLLSYPASRAGKEALRKFDVMIKNQYPEIYHANVNYAVSLLRVTNYLLYGIESIAVRKKY